MKALPNQVQLAVQGSKLNGVGGGGAERGNAGRKQICFESKCQQSKEMVYCVPLKPSPMILLGHESF